MTWLTFKRGLSCLGVKTATIVFTLNHLRHRTRHKLVLEFGEPVKLDEEADEEGKKPPTELSIFLPSIMHALGVNIATFDRLLTSYMLRHRIDPSRNKRVSVRGNLKKSLLDRRLSWANFIKGLDFLTIPSFDVEINLTFHGRRKSRKLPHTDFIIINDVEDLLAEMTEEDFFTPNVQEMTNGEYHYSVSEPTGDSVPETT